MPAATTAGKPERRITWPTVLRLSEYLIILEELADSHTEVVSSRELAAIYGNNANQVRQDLSSLGHTGRVGQGYSVKELEQMIRRALGLNVRRNLALVGCGRLGTTVALHVPLAKYGMDLVAAFDVAHHLVGTHLGPVMVEHASRIAEVCRERNIKLAVLTVPKSTAQESADQLVLGGVEGILNYTRVRLRVPPHVVVQNRQIVCSFLQLFHATCNRDRMAPGDTGTAPAIAL
ncbi:MAG: redox-sensing transcriptional repressor Rex [Lentisphaeria bacterium]|jgi:redox-sensing transcriptional repressor